MADISARGYVNYLKVREGSKGSFNSFSLATTQKERDGSKTRVYFDVTDFSGNKINDGDYVEVAGRFKVRTYKDKEGKDRQSFGITANTVTDASGQGHGSGGGSHGSSEPDPWDNA